MDDDDVLHCDFLFVVVVVVLPRQAGIGGVSQSVSQSVLEGRVGRSQLDDRRLTGSCVQKHRSLETFMCGIGNDLAHHQGNKWRVKL